MTNTDLVPTDQPIGFWLKLVDGLINENIATTLGEDDLTRRHWQMLTELQNGPATVARLDDTIKPFLVDGETTVEPVIAELRRRGWVARSGDEVAVTEAGLAAHAELHRKVSGTRRRITEGIDHEEYRSIIGVLARMATNLGWTGKR